MGLYEVSREFEAREKAQTTRPRVNPLLVPVTKAEARVRRKPIPRPGELEGARALPGLEGWAAPGRRGCEAGSHLLVEKAPRVEVVLLEDRHEHLPGQGTDQFSLGSSANRTDHDADLFRK